MFPPAPLRATSGRSVSKSTRTPRLDRTRPPSFPPPLRVSTSGGILRMRGHGRSAGMLGVWILDGRNLCYTWGFPPKVLLGRIPMGERQHQVQTRGFHHGVTMRPGARLPERRCGIIRTGDSSCDATPPPSHPETHTRVASRYHRRLPSRHDRVTVRPLPHSGHPNRTRVASIPQRPSLALFNPHGYLGTRPAPGPNRHSLQPGRTALRVRGSS